MPLYLNGTKLAADSCLTKRILSCASLVEGSKDFLSKEAVKTLSIPDRALFVSQREYATVSRKDETLNFVGSEDATTCHIVVLVSSSAVSVGHFDGSDTKCGLSQMINENEMLSIEGDRTERKDQPPIEVYIYGGFEDDQNISVKLLEDILIITANAEQELQLKTMCVYSWNTCVINNKKCPIIYGVAVNIKTGEIFPASFESKGPCEVLRHARIFGGSDEMVSIYDSKSKVVTIGPFIYRLFRGAHTIFMLDDNQILQNLSTSPHCEPVDFVHVTRNAVKFLVEHPYPSEIFKNGKALTYKLNGDGKWDQLGS